VLGAVAELLARSGSAGAGLLSSSGAAVLQQLLAWRAQPLSCSTRVGSREASLWAALLARLAQLGSAETGELMWAGAPERPEFLLAALRGGSDSACAEALSSSAASSFSSSAAAASCAAFAAEALNAVAEQYGSEASSAPAWGTDVHRVWVSHAVLGGTLLGCLANRAVPHGGDDSTVNVGHPELSSSPGEAGELQEAGAFAQTHGPSVRHLMDLSEGYGAAATTKSLFMQPMGQEGDLLAANYDSLLKGWAQGEYLSMVVEVGGGGQVLQLAPL
jgi:acyl-homoserine lactone acylase PvdQ